MQWFIVPACSVIITLQMGCASVPSNNKSNSRVETAWRIHHREVDREWLTRESEQNKIEPYMELRHLQEKDPTQKQLLWQREIRLQLDMERERQKDREGKRMGE